MTVLVGAHRLRRLLENRLNCNNHNLHFKTVFMTVLDGMSRLHTKTFYGKRLCMLCKFTTVMGSVFVGLYYVVIL